LRVIELLDRYERPVAGLVWRVGKKEEDRRLAIAYVKLTRRTESVTWTTVVNFENRLWFTYQEIKPLELKLVGRSIISGFSVGEVTERDGWLNMILRSFSWFSNAQIDISAILRYLLSDLGHVH
jgi:hypothetical protein